MNSKTQTTATPEAIELLTGAWHYGQPSTAATSDAQVSWRSGDPAVVAVNETSGYMYGVSPGTATVYAVTDGGEQAAYTVTVAEPTLVTGVQINGAPTVLNRGDICQLEADVTPENATDKSLYWCSSNTAVATVDPDTGKLRTWRAGPVTIRASALDGSGKEHSVNIRVKNVVQTGIQQTSASTAVTAGLRTNPVDLYNGSHILHKTVMPLFGGQNLALTLHYDSAKLAQGVFGKGWYHNFEKHVYRQDLGSDCLLYDNPSTYYRYAAPEGAGTDFYCSAPDRNGYVLTTACPPPYSYALDCNSERTEYYDSDGRLAKIVDHQGYEILISYTATRITLTDGVTGKHIYLDRPADTDCVTHVRDDAGRVAILRRGEEDALLAELCDVNGCTFTFTYDENDRMQSATHKGEEVAYLQNTYDDPTTGYGYLASQESANASTRTTFAYENNTRTLTDKSGAQTACTFDTNGLLTSITDALGNTTTYAYDEHYNLTCETDVRGNTVEKTYNAFNKPTSVTDKNGNTTTYTYDAKGNLTAITYPAVDGVSATESFAYDTRNRLTSHTDRRGTTTVYSYYDGENGLLETKTVGEEAGEVIARYVYENGLLKSETDARGNTVTYTYNGFGKVATKTDAQGKTTTYEYDNLGNLTKATDPLGNTVTLSYDHNGRKLSQTDACGNTTTYTYMPNGELESVKDAAGNTTRYAYDAAQHSATVTDAAGNVTAKHYDALGRLVQTDFADGSSLLCDYDELGNLVKESKQKKPQTDEQGNPLPVEDEEQVVTLYTYDPMGNPLTATDEENNVIRYRYDAMGRCVAAVNAVGGTTVYEYSAAGDLLSETDPIGNKRSYTYDALGRCTAVTDPRGNTTAYTYDANGNLLTVKNALDQTTTYTYDDLNRCISVKDAANHTTTYGYDALGRRTTVTDPRGNTFTTVYDANGNVLKTVDAKENIVSEATYNALNLPAVVTDAQGKTTTYTYNALGKVATAVDALERTTAFTYDSRGRTTTVTDPNNKESRVTYDILGNLTEMTGPGGAKTVYTYDAMGRKTAETTPSAETITSGETTTAVGTVSYTYNAQNIKASMKNARGQEHRFFYDAAGRITGWVSPEDSVGYTYDANGNVLTVADRNGIVTREYDALNRVTKCTDTYGKVVCYEYDAAGNLAKLTYPGGQMVWYNYDGNHNLTGVTDWYGRYIGYTYDENNRVVQISRRFGGTTDYTYDEKGRLLSQLTLAQGRLLTGYEYAYDALGRLIEEKDLAKNVELCYTYDNLDRLTNVTHKSLLADVVLSQDTFTYDDASNLTNESAYDQNNRLSSFHGATHTYDEDGNMLTLPYLWDDKLLSYDSANRLISAGDCTYTYHAEGNRIRLQRTENGTGYDTTYVYDTNAPLPRLLEKTTNGVTTRYVYGLGLLAEEKGLNYGAYKNYLFDRRGSTVAIVDVNNTVTDTLTYNAYGRQLSHTGDSFVIFGYNGRDGVITDANGLLYMRARYYSPVIRRFVNADILHGDISNSVTLNRYAYANCNPAMNVDPSGLFSLGDVGNFFNSIGNWFAEAATNVSNFIDSALNNSGTALKKIADVLGDELQPIVESAGEEFDKTIHEPLAIITQVPRQITRKIFSHITLSEEVKTKIDLGISAGSFLFGGLVTSTFAALPFILTGNVGAGIAAGVSAFAPGGAATMGVTNNIVNAIYYDWFSSDQSALDTDSYSKNGSTYHNRFDRLDYTRKETGEDYYSNNAWRYYSEYSAHMHVWNLAYFLGKSESAFADRAKDASVDTNAWDENGETVFLTIVAGLLGM